MHKSIVLTIGLTAILTGAGCSSLQSQKLQVAADTLGVDAVKSIEFSGTGRWFQFGQAPNTTSPWPAFNLKNYTADINYETASARVQIARIQLVEPLRVRPAPVEQRVDQYISNNTAWNIATTGTPTPTLQPATTEERAAEIWATPQGFLKAAKAHNAETKSTGDSTEISFTVNDKYKYIGHLNAQNQVNTIQTWIDNPVLGDTLVETQFSDYKDFGGVQFPSHILRKQGGYPVLDLNVSSVKANPAVEITAPKDVKAPEVVVTLNKLANGVFYITGGTHHSVAIEQADHIVLVEAPQNEERSLAVISKLKETFPNKPIKFLINSHAHFDHSGGLRTYVNEGSTILTLKPNQDYYEKVWANPHTINPDLLSISKKPAIINSFTNKLKLTDGNRDIEIHSIAGNTHNDAFVLVYLPKEKILVEADAFTVPAANAPAPTSINPYTLNLYENIQKLNLDVQQIAGLHGPRVATLEDLRTAITPANATK